MTEPTKLTLDAALEVEGREDTTQLEVKAHAAQTEPLQEWQDASGDALGRVTGDGRLQLGDLALEAPEALVEANQTIELPSDTPLRGWQSLGRISGAIGDAIAWAAHELQLLGSGGVSGLHTALRAVLTLDNSGDTSLAEVRAGDFEVANNSDPVGKVAGVVSAITNLEDGSIGEAIAFAVAPPVNQGTIGALVGLDVPDLDQADENFAIRTGKGRAHLGDYLEMEQLATPPDEAAGVVKVYPKTDGKLYAKAPGGTEYDLTGGGGGSTVDAEGTAGEALSERDIVYLKAADNKWYKVDADATGGVKVSAIRGMAAEDIAQDATGTIRVHGEVGGFSGLTAGALVYASTTAGGYTQTKPTPTLDGSQICLITIGFATSTTAVLVEPDHVQFARRAALSNDEVLTIEHYADAAIRQRTLMAIAGVTVATSLASYPESNQDQDVSLRGDIRDGMIAWWALEETSGSRADSHGSNTLTDNNTVTSNPGQVGTAGQFTAANTEYLSIADNADLSVSDIDFCFSVWIYLDSLGASRTILSKDGVSANREYILYTDGANKLNWFVGNGIGAVVHPTALSASTWYHVYCYHDSVNNKVGISLNNGTVQEATTTGAPANGTRQFEIGNRTSSPLLWNGRIDEVAFWKTRLLNTNERAWLYNDGSGRSYAETVTKDKLSQSFQLPSGSPVDKARLYLKKVGSPTGTLTLRIETDSSGNPSGTLADANASATLGESSLAAGYGYIDVDFATNFNLSGSVPYHLVLSTDRSADEANYVVWGADGNAPGYADGEMKYNASSAWSAESKDAVFDLFSPLATLDEPRVVGAWSGGTRDIAVKYLDAVDANGDTNTSFKNVTGSTLSDVTCIVEVP